MTKEWFKQRIVNILKAAVGIGKTTHLESFKEQYDFEKGFEKFYKENLKDHLVKAEKVRLFYSSIISRRLFITFLTAVFLIILDIKFFGVAGVWYIILFVVIIPAMLWWAFLPTRTYSNNIKEIVFRPIFRYLGDFSFSPHPEASSNIALFKKAGILPKFSSYESEDHISGHYRKVNFHIEEISLKRKITKKLHRETYRGLLIFVDCPKPFYGQTVVISAKKPLPENLKNVHPPLRRVFLKDPTVESEYHIYSTNREEAGYLLINAFMERIGNLGDVFAKYNRRQRRKVECSFVNKKLLLAVECRHNLFEAESVFKPIDTSDLRLIIAQVHWIFKVIDTLFHKLPKDTIVDEDNAADN